MWSHKIILNANIFGVFFRFFLPLFSVFILTSYVLLAEEFFVWFVRGWNGGISGYVTLFFYYAGILSPSCIFDGPGETQASVERLRNSKCHWCTFCVLGSLAFWAITWKCAVGNPCDSGWWIVGFSAEDGFDAVVPFGGLANCKRTLGVYWAV